MTISSKLIYEFPPNCANDACQLYLVTTESIAFKLASSLFCLNKHFVKLVQQSWPRSENACQIYGFDRDPSSKTGISQLPHMSTLFDEPFWSTSNQRSGHVYFPNRVQHITFVNQPRSRVDTVKTVHTRRIRPRMVYHFWPKCEVIKHQPVWYCSSRSIILLISAWKQNSHQFHNEIILVDFLLVRCNAFSTLCWTFSFRRTEIVWPDSRN